MPTPRGLFAPELLPEGWFDETQRPEGWFSQDFLEPVSSAPVTATVNATIPVVTSVNASHGVSSTLSSTISLTSAFTASHGVAGTISGEIPLTASFNAVHGVSATLTGQIGLVSQFEAQHGNATSQPGGKSKYRSRKISAATKPTTTKNPPIKTRPSALSHPEAEEQLEKPALEPVTATFNGVILFISRLEAKTERANTPIEQHLKNYGVPNHRDTARMILQALKTRSNVEKPKAIIRSVLISVGITGRTLDILTSLIFTAWDGPRAVYAVAA